ncbi:MAG: zinc-finger domain-containing protein [Gammaproteobacteria bacterium]
MKKTSIVKKRAALQKRYEVKADDLPLSCPMPDMRLWDAHPRVYLPIEATGYVVCPYCSAEYFLKDVE